jgi:hypothetical protein
VGGGVVNYEQKYYRSLEIIQNSDDYHTEDLRRALIYRGYEDALDESLEN